VPLTGLLSLLDFDVQSQVEPFQATAWTVHIKVGRVAIGSMCNMISHIRDLRAETRRREQASTQSLALITSLSL
jgi:exosortase/archaeosortase